MDNVGDSTTSRKMGSRGANPYLECPMVEDQMI